MRAVDDQSAARGVARLTINFKNGLLEAPAVTLRTPLARFAPLGYRHTGQGSEANPRGSWSLTALSPQNKQNTPTEQPREGYDYDVSKRLYRLGCRAAGFASVFGAPGNRLKNRAKPSGLVQTNRSVLL